MISTKVAHSKHLLSVGNRAFAAKGTRFEKFNWEDPLNLDMKLTDDERMIY